mgnify:CR=1 FL=1
MPGSCFSIRKSVSILVPHLCFRVFSRSCYLPFGRTSSEVCSPDARLKRFLAALQPPREPEKRLLFRGSPENNPSTPRNPFTGDLFSPRRLGGLPFGASRFLGDRSTLSPARTPVGSRLLGFSLRPRRRRSSSELPALSLRARPLPFPEGSIESVDFEVSGCRRPGVSLHECADPCSLFHRFR